VKYAPLYRIAGIAALLTVAITLAQIVFGIVWPPPDFAPTAASAASVLEMAQAEPVRAFVSLDGLMIVDYLLLLVVYLALHAAQKERQPSLSTLGTGLALVAIALYLTANPALTTLVLAGQYDAATAATSGIVPATQMVFANFQGTAFLVHYVVMGVAGILVSVAMLRSGIFSRATAVAGIAQGTMMLVPVTFGTIGLVFALGSLVPFIVWFVLVGRTLLRLASAEGS
jgi:hypothetical protein